MSTRCLTVFYDGSGKEICVLYRHSDGYINGHGKQLYNYLKDKKLGCLTLDKNKLIFNGMEDLAAMVISHFKKEPGQFYLYAANKRDLWENYIYHVTGKEEKIQIEVESVSKKTRCNLLDELNILSMEECETCPK